MDFFKIDGQRILIDVYCLELYLDEEYLNRELLRIGSGDYKVFGVGSIRAFNGEAQLDKRHDLPLYTLALPLFFTTIPSENEMMDISAPKGAPYKQMICLRYFKGDVFINNKSLIKSSDNAEIVWNLMEDGKMESVPYEHIPIILGEITPDTNDSKNKVSIETIHAVVSERYRDPNNINVKVRHMKKLPPYVVAVNPREGASMSTTFGMISFEDINTALLTANNRAKAGTLEPITTVEKILRGIR